jgi:hypothetical protein
MMNAAAIARALGADVVGLDRILCPGPGHSPKDRSLSVWFKSDAPSGFLVHSFAGDDQLECRNHILFLLGFDPWRPGSTSRTGQNFRARREESKTLPSLPEDSVAHNANGERALEIWSAARPLLGTLGEVYLRKRGIHLEAVPGIYNVIRWVPACPWGRAVQSCIVALFTDVHTVEPRAIHRIGIAKNAEKLDRRSLGPIGGCVIRLWPDEAVTMGVGAGRGNRDGSRGRDANIASQHAPATGMGSGLYRQSREIPGVSCCLGSVRSVLRNNYACM